MKELPRLIFDGKFLRVKLPSGEMLPETELKIENYADQGKECFVTVSFLCEIDLAENKTHFTISGNQLKNILKGK